MNKSELLSNKPATKKEIYRAHILMLKNPNKITWKQALKMAKEELRNDR